MKYKISISVNKETLFRVQEAMRKGRFRSKSHAFEYAVNKLLWGDVE